MQFDTESLIQDLNNALKSHKSGRAGIFFYSPSHNFYQHRCLNYVCTFNQQTQSCKNQPKRSYFLIVKIPQDFQKIFGILGDFHKTFGIGDSKILKFIRQFSSFLTTLKSFVLPLLLHKTVHALNHWFSSCTTLVARVHCKCIGLGCIITILSSVAIFDFLLPPRSKKCHKNLWKCRDFWL